MCKESIYSEDNDEKIKEVLVKLKHDVLEADRNFLPVNYDKYIESIKDIFKGDKK